MINILFITSSLEKNGTEEFMMNVLRGLDKIHYHADFLLFTEYSQAQKTNSIEAESLGSKIYRLPARRSGCKYYKSLDNFFKEKKGYYNAVHWNEGSMTTIMPIYYARKYGVPVRIIHAHNSNSEGFFNKLQHSLNKKFNLKYCTHRFAGSSLAADFFFNSEKSKVIKNGIVLNKFLYNENIRMNLRKLLEVDESTLVIGHVGRFTTVKNQSFIIDIYKQIYTVRPNSKLVFIGIGECMDEVKCKALENNIQENVLFLGLQNNVNEWMQAFDVFLMPSLFEGLPFVLVEAQASGLPCLISDTINKDAAITQNCQFMSLKDSPKNWADRVFQITLSSKRANMESVIQKEGFSIENTVQYLQSVYSGLV